MDLFLNPELFLCGSDRRAGWKKDKGPQPAALGQGTSVPELCLILGYACKILSMSVDLFSPCCLM